MVCIQQPIEVSNEGYALGFEKAIKYIDMLMPSAEDINAVIKTNTSALPIVTIREMVANALVHQDFFVTGAGVVNLYARMC